MCRKTLTIPEAYTNGLRMNLSIVPFSCSICVIDTEWQECLCLPACLPATITVLEQISARSK